MSEVAPTPYRGQKGNTMSNKIATFFHHTYLMNGSITTAYNSGEKKDWITVRIRRDYVPIKFHIAWPNKAQEDGTYCGLLLVNLPRKMEKYGGELFKSHYVKSVSELIDKLQFYGLWWMPRHVFPESYEWYPWPKDKRDYPRPTL
jgi:hypothetical protein